MFKWILLISSSITFSNSALADGFQSGNQFQSVNLFGSLTIICNDPMYGTGMDVVSCYENILLPTESDYFVSTSSQKAKYVTLVAQHEDGSTVTKKVRYNQAKQRSSDRVNLWVSTLTQMPLLERGLNTISVTYLSAQDTITQTAQFTAAVADGGTRTCPTDTYFSSNITDCRGMGSSLCYNYFANNNYCQ